MVSEGKLHVKLRVGDGDRGRRVERRVAEQGVVCDGDELHGAGGPHESVVELRAAEGEEDGRKIGGEGAQLAPVVC